MERLKSLSFNKSVIMIFFVITFCYLAFFKKAGLLLVLFLNAFYYYAFNQYLKHINSLKKIKLDSDLNEKIQTLEHKVQNLSIASGFKKL